MPVERDRIYPKDTYTVSFECLLPSNDGIGQYTPITPVAASVKLMNTLEETFIPLGGPDLFEAPAGIEGNTVSYTVPSEFTDVEESTDFKLFLTVEFEDGTIKTQPHTFTVMEYR